MRASVSLHASSELPPAGMETAEGLVDNLNHLFVPPVIARHSKYPPLTVDLSPTFEQASPSLNAATVDVVVALVFVAVGATLTHLSTLPDLVHLYFTPFVV